MLDLAIIDHPATTPAVLERATALPLPATSMSRLAVRLNRLDLLAGSIWDASDINSLVRHPNLTAEARAVILHSLDNYKAHSVLPLRDLPAATLTQLVQAGRQLLIFPEAAQMIALNPHCPRNLLLRALDALMTRGLSAMAAIGVMAALDLHQLHISALGNITGRLYTRALRTYAQQGSLARYLEHERHLLEPDAVTVLNCTSDAAAAHVALDRCGGSRSVLLAALESRLPDSVHNKALRLAVAAGDQRALFAAARMWDSLDAGAPDDLFTALVDGVDDAAGALLAHTRTPARVEQALERLYSTSAPNGITLTLAVAANRSDLPSPLRARILELATAAHTPSRHQHEVQALLATARTHLNDGLPNADLLPVPYLKRTGDVTRILYPGLVKATLDAHPELLTNPDITYTALALAPTFTGTLAELIATATQVAN